MIDQFGLYDDAISEASKLANLSNPTIVDYEEYDFWSTIFNAASSINPFMSLEKAIDTSPGPKLMYMADRF